MKPSPSENSVEFLNQGAFLNQVEFSNNGASAALKFSAEISTRNLRRNLIGVSGWSCSNDQITASISSSIQALVNFPILSRINGGKIGVNATIGATSEISGT